MPYAIFKTGGKQYKVQKGDEIDVDKLALDIGGETSFGDVLFFTDGSAIKIGDPMVEGASVTAKVVEQFRAKKVTAFKFKRRKGYHRKKGHRQHLTRVEITGITV
ncbi:MAG: 50S ribosomal protein L21 [Verrucomicrobiales bacterium]